MFSFAWPWVFLLLPLPFLAWWLMPAAKQRLGAALKVPFLDFIAATHGRSEQITLRRLLIWPSLLWLLLLLACAGPQWIGEPIEVQNEGRSIMLAVDLSGSMQTPDMNMYGQAVSRLELVKAIAGEFIKNRTGDRIGLILFGSQAYLQTPLTRDRETVVKMLDDATVGLAGTQTAIGDGVGLSIKRLTEYPRQSRVLVLLTDGQNNAGAVAPIEAAKMAAKEGIRIYTIGLGASQMIINTPFGPQAMPTNNDLDETTLKNISKLTGGEYFRAKNAADLARVYSSINQLEPVKADQSTFRPIKPLYPWPLAGALLLSVVWLLWERWRMA